MQNQFSIFLITVLKCVTSKILVEISPMEVISDDHKAEEILIIELNVKNAPEIFNDGTKFYNLLFASRNDSNFDKMIEEFHAAAVDFKNEQVGNEFYSYG